MIYLVLGVVLAAAVAWFVYPPAREFLDGLKTRITGWIIVVMGVIEQMDEQLLSQALGLDSKGKAWLYLGLGVSVLLFREMTKKPGMLVK